MRRLEEMKNWSYKEAYEFALDVENRKCFPEMQEYVSDLTVVPTFDLRKKSNARKMIVESINSRTFILVDGASRNGKTTFANRLAKEIDGIVLDIDYLCKEWGDKELENAKDMIEYFKIATNIGTLTDNFLLMELENIVRQKSELNKPVILVGMYLDLMFRTVIFKCFGKRYFEKIVSILCFKDSFKKVEYLIKSGEQEFGGTVMPGEREKCLGQYNIVRDIVIKQKGISLGLGVDRSFIINTDVSNKFKD